MTEVSKDNPENNSKEMAFWDHVEELRKRLLISLAGLIVATFASFLIAEEIIFILAQPAGSIEALQSIEVTENIAVFMRVSLLTGFILSMPLTLYQLLMFILPGLKNSEKRWVFLTITFGTILFIAGAAFAYFVMLPASVTFLLQFLGITTKPRLSSYINFITNLIFWLGVAFQFPIIIFGLVKLNIITPRTLAKGWRYALVFIAVLAAMITPTVDPVNMGLLMAPLFILYILSVFVAFIAKKPKKEE